MQVRWTHIINMLLSIEKLFAWTNMECHPIQFIALSDT